MPSLLSKKGQPSTYSPRTLESSRNRLGNFLSSIASLGSPLGAKSGRSAVELPDSPLKARIYRRGGPEGSEEELGQGLADVRLMSPGAAGGSRGRGGRGVVDSAVEIPEVKMGEGRVSILDLPDDLILLILEHLPKSAQQLHTVSLVSRRFFEYAQSPTLWVGLYHSTPGYRLSEDAAKHGVAAVIPPPLAAGWYYLDRSSRPGTTPLSTPVRKSLTRTPTSSSPFPPRSSTMREIPIHYPSLYRSRYTLSHAIRRPSPECRSHTESLKEHSDSVYCIKSAGRCMFTGSRDRSVRIWRLGEYDDQGQVGSTVLIRTLPDAHEGSVLCLDIELDKEGNGTMITGSSDRTVKVWNVAITGNEAASGDPVVQLKSTLSGHTSGVLDVVLGERHIISCSKDGSIRIYDRETLALLHAIAAHAKSANSLELSPDGRTMASAGGEGTWAIWEIASGQEIRREGDSKGPGLACLAWQGGYIATGDNARNVSIYSASTGQLLRVCRGHTDLVRAVAIDVEDGLVVSGSYDGSVRIWDLYTGIMIRNIPGPELIFDIHLKPNKLLVARQDETIQVISLVTGLPYLNLMVEE